VTRSSSVRAQPCGLGKTDVPSWEHRTSSAKKLTNAHSLIIVGTPQTLIRKNRSKSVCPCTHRITEPDSDGKAKTTWNLLLTIINTMDSIVRLGSPSQTIKQGISTLQDAQARTTFTSMAKKFSNLTPVTLQIMKSNASSFSTLLTTFLVRNLGRTMSKPLVDVRWTEFQIRVSVAPF
jgi:hypothetical protein